MIVFVMLLILLVLGTVALIVCIHGAEDEIDDWNNCWFDGEKDEE